MKGEEPVTTRNDLKKTHNNTHRVAGENDTQYKSEGIHKELMRCAASLKIMISTGLVRFSLNQVLAEMIEFQLPMV